jgi:hypothetical protein
MNSSQNRVSPRWRIIQGAWLLSTGGIVSTVSALVGIYFIFPLVAGAVGLSEAIEAADAMAGTVETAADGSIVKMLLIALIVSLCTQGALVWMIIRNASRPCLMQSEHGKTVVRDTLRECWRDAKRQEG